MMTKSGESNRRKLKECRTREKIRINSEKEELMLSPLDVREAELVTFRMFN